MRSRKGTQVWNWMMNGSSQMCLSHLERAESETLGPSGGVRSRSCCLFCLASYDESCCGKVPLPSEQRPQPRRPHAHPALRCHGAASSRAPPPPACRGQERGLRAGAWPCLLTLPGSGDRGRGTPAARTGRSRPAWAHGSRACHPAVGPLTAHQARKQVGRLLSVIGFFRRNCVEQ